jgi:hypothetical protein
MPQLDKVAFFTQIFWALFVYLFLYILLSTYVCPAIGLTLKSRLRINLKGEGQLIASNVEDLFRPAVKLLSSSEEASACMSNAFKLAKKSSYLTTGTYLK